MNAALLLVVLASAPETSSDDPFGVMPEVAPLRSERNFAVPLVEAALTDVLLAAFNNLVTRQAFAQISAQTIANNLNPTQWTFDNDYFVTNQFGHPYQGSVSFVAARSSGLSFWWATLYPFVASLAWELLLEKEAPSVNDQITTTLGGVFLGEVLFRVSALFLDPTSRLPEWLRETFAALAAPMASLNRFLFSDRFAWSGVPQTPWYRGSFGVGTFLQRREVGFFIASDLVYGNATLVPNGPFSHFTLRASLSVARAQVTGDLNLTGLLWGRHFETGPLVGVAGLFGAYEYVAPRVLRASSVNLGGGVMVRYPFLPSASLEITAIASGIAFGAGGLVSQNANTEGVRDYHIGPGIHLVAEIRAIEEQLGALTIGIRRWNFFGGLYTAPAGFDAITYFSGTATFRLSRRVSGSVELVHALRDARFEATTIAQSTTQLHFYFSWLFSESLGASTDSP